MSALLHTLEKGLMLAAQIFMCGFMNLTVTLQGLCIRNQRNIHTTSLFFLKPWKTAKSESTELLKTQAQALHTYAPFFTQTAKSSILATVPLMAAS